MNTEQNFWLPDVLELDWKVDELDWKVDELEWDIEPIYFEPIEFCFNKTVIRE
jgi:hypothetical protein